MVRIIYYQPDSQVYFFNLFYMGNTLYRCYSLLDIFSNFEAVKKQIDEGTGFAIPDLSDQECNE